MAPRTFTITRNDRSFDAYLSVNAYVSPPPPHGRLFVQIMTRKPDWGPIFTVLSVNMPEFPTPPPTQFYVKTWGGNEGLLEQLADQGILRVVNPEGTVINQWGSKVFLAELTWPDEDMEINVQQANGAVLH